MNQTGQRSKESRLPCLDGLRAISILFVVVSHCQHTINGGLPFLVGFLFAKGGLGVFIFFVLSGYLITWLLRQERERTGSISLRAFYARRAIRIFPAFYTYLGVLILLCALGVFYIRKQHFLWAGIYLWNYEHLWDSEPAVGVGFRFLGHLWSLSLEEQFYLLWPGALVLLGLRRAVFAALALVLFMPVSRVLTYFLFPGSRGQVFMMVHTGADALMFGCLLALCQGHPGLEAAFERFRRPAWPIIAALLAWIALPELQSALPGHLSGAFDLTIGRTLSGLCIAFVVGWLLRHPTSVAGRFLNTRLLVHTGVLSYSIYLWQTLFLAPENRSWAGRFPLNLVCLLAVAHLSYWLVEKPCRNLRNRFRAGTGALPKSIVVPASEMSNAG